VVIHENLAKIDSLPNEILDLVFRIFFVFHKPELWNCIRVSRLWHDLAVRYLWRDLYFASDPNDRDYSQNRMFRVLEENHALWRRFSYTKSLVLKFNNQGYPVSTKAHCVAIVTEFERMQIVMHWASAYIETLRLDLEPFIMDDVDNDELWQYLRYANQIIRSVAELASDIAETRKVKVTLVIGRPHWRYHPTSRIAVQEIISILGPSLTGLDLSETSVLDCTHWVSQTTKLKKLSLTQISQEDLNFGGYPPAEIWSRFWGRLCELPLLDLSLSGADVRLLNLDGNIGNLQYLLLCDVENTPSLCQNLFIQLHQLRDICVNNERGGDISTANNATFKGPVASKELRSVSLFGSTVPVGLIPAIADVSSHLWCLLLPKNATDDDVQALDSLRLLELLGATKCETLGPRYLHIVSQLELPVVEMVTCQWKHLSCLTRDVLFRLAKGSPLLKEIGFEDFARVPEKRLIREGTKALTGISSFGRWVKKFMEVEEKVAGHHLWINLVKIREEPGYKQFVRLRRYEKV
jgi:hypothetical protein